MKPMGPALSDQSPSRASRHHSQNKYLCDPNPTPTTHRYKLPTMTPAYHSLREYTRRMNRVLEHIDQHLDQPLELADLAQIAHFSPWHFHRLFTAWVGETLGDYLRRRRLACAAQQLASRPEASILQIALEVGFSSGEAFSRAFKQHFSVTPSTWRATEPERWDQRLAGIRERRQQQLSNPDQAGRPLRRF